MTDPPESAFDGFRIQAALEDDPRAGAYEATELATGRTVVIETLLGEAARDRDLRDWFSWAWAAVAELRHAGVVAVHGTGRRNGVPFAVRESVEGDDLSTLLEAGGSLTDEVLLTAFDRIAAAVGALHEAGVVHGDLSPRRVLLPSDSLDAPRLTGFGRVEGSRPDDIRALGNLLESMLAASGEDGPRPELDAVLERAREGGYRSVPELAGAVAATAPPASAGVPAVGANAEAFGEPPASAGSGRSRRGLSLALLGLAVAAIAIWLVTGDGDSDEASAPRDAATVAPSGATSVAPTDAVPPPPPGVSVTGEGGGGSGSRKIFVPGSPIGVAARDGLVYVATKRGQLLGFDEGSGKLSVGPIELGSAAAGITIIDRVAWVSLPDEGALARIDLGADAPASESIDVGSEPGGPIGVRGSIWVASEADGSLSMVPQSGSSPPETVPIEARRPREIAYGLGSLWVTDATGSVVRVDPEDPDRTSSFPVGDGPRGVVVADGRVWVANAGDGTISSIDPASGEIEELDVGGTPLDLAAEPDRIWVANGDGYASSIELGSGEVTRVELPAGGGSPQGVAVGSRVWVTTGGGDSLVAVGAAS